jgi:hypothetical protein
LYRFDEVNVQWMATYFMGQEKNEKRGGALSNVDKLKIFLRCVGDPGFQTGVAEDIGIHQTTVSKIIVEIMDKILPKASTWIKFAQTEAKIQNAKREWLDKYNFPAAIGVIDCTHIRIVKPSVHGDEYINRKGFPSINVQATCNSEEWFTSVDVSWPGSVHDARIWRNSDIKRVMEENREKALLLGDEGYGIAPWLMTPFKNPQTPEERAYNKLFTKERVIIERCFGQLKQRFPVLQYKVRLALKSVPKLIICCFILHNIAKYLKDEMELLQQIDLEENEIQEEPMNNIRFRGQQKRREIAYIIYEQNL